MRRRVFYSEDEAYEMTKQRKEKWEVFRRVYKSKQSAKKNHEDAPKGSVVVYDDVGNWYILSPPNSIKD